MNFWMPPRSSQRTFFDGLCPSAWRSLMCAILLLWAGAFAPVSSPVLAQTTAAIVSRPEYIYTPPQSAVQTNTDDYKVTVEFAWNQ